MKHLFLVSMIFTLTAWANCPSETLIKKSGSRTHYSTDLKTTYRQSDLEKFGCKLNYQVMSSKQRSEVLEVEYNKKKAAL